ncbi:hypothetical protein AB1Y20_004691 [Prymnesium parvum]|uniref:Sfi1 spindle body domain-containing protein n=1 Tax=Prymnesium parvum TaxID=97485 RepID=A0AB34IZZ2_PRYPA
MVVTVETDAARRALYCQVWRRRCRTALHWLKHHAAMERAAWPSAKKSLHPSSTTQRAALGVASLGTAESIGTHRHAPHRHVPLAAQRCSSPLQPKNLFDDDEFDRAARRSVSPHPKNHFDDGRFERSPRRGVSPHPKNLFDDGGLDRSPRRGVSPHPKNLFDDGGLDRSPRRGVSPHPKNLFDDGGLDRSPRRGVSPHPKNLFDDSGLDRSPRRGVSPHPKNLFDDGGLERSPRRGVSPHARTGSSSPPRPPLSPACAVLCRQAMRTWWREAQLRAVGRAIAEGARSWHVSSARRAALSQWRDGAGRRMLRRWLHTERAGRVACVRVWRRWVRETAAYAARRWRYYRAWRGAFFLSWWRWRRAYAARALRRWIHENDAVQREARASAAAATAKIRARMQTAAALHSWWCATARERELLMAIAAMRVLPPAFPLRCSFAVWRAKVMSVRWQHGKAHVRRLMRRWKLFALLHSRETVGRAVVADAVRCRCVHRWALYAEGQHRSQMLLAMSSREARRYRLRRVHAAWECWHVKASAGCLEARQQGLREEQSFIDSLRLRKPPTWRDSFHCHSAR